MVQTFDRWLDIPMTIRDRLKYRVTVESSSTAYGYLTESWTKAIGNELACGFGVLIRSTPDGEGCQRVEYAVMDFITFSEKHDWMIRPHDDAEVAAQEDINERQHKLYHEKVEAARRKMEGG